MEKGWIRRKGVVLGIGQERFLFLFHQRTHRIAVKQRDYHARADLADQVATLTKVTLLATKKSALPSTAWTANWMKNLTPRDRVRVRLL